MSLILLDQNVPRALSKLLTGQDVRAVADHGWQEFTNGDLLSAAESAGFAAIVTADQNIRYQQNLTGRRIAVIVLSTNHWPTLRVNIGGVIAAVERIASNSFEYVDCGLTPKHRRSRPAEPSR